MGLVAREGKYCSCTDVKVVRTMKEVMLVVRTMKEVMLVVRTVKEVMFVVRTMKEVMLVVRTMKEVMLGRFSRITTRTFWVGA